ncbi:MAG: hypothetical protein OXB84_03810 [Halobacteriovoraceae bacterium]|nr:hypothetical protein [Halobacteriovoraceae bacterium]
MKFKILLLGTFFSFNLFASGIFEKDFACPGAILLSYQQLEYCVDVLDVKDALKSKSKIRIENLSITPRSNQSKTNERNYQLSFTAWRSPRAKVRINCYYFYINSISTVRVDECVTSNRYLGGIPSFEGVLTFEELYME